jgi:hypothetical protein
VRALSDYKINIGTVINIPGMSSPDSAGSRILSFMTRPRGWKYGRGEPPNISTISAAMIIAATMLDLGAKKTGAFLTEDGGIVVTGYFSDWTSEVLCSASGEYTLIVEKDGNEEELEETTTLQLAAKVLTSQVERWEREKSTIEYFTLTTLTSTGSDFRVGQSFVALGTEKYLYSMSNVPKNIAGQFAVTYVQDIHTLQANLLYTGNFESSSAHLMPTLSNRQSMETFVTISSRDSQTNKRANW